MRLSTYETPGTLCVALAALRAGGRFVPFAQPSSALGVLVSVRRRRGPNRARLVAPLLKVDDFIRAVRREPAEHRPGAVMGVRSELLRVLRAGAAHGGSLGLRVHQGAGALHGRHGLLRRHERALRGRSACGWVAGQAGRRARRTCLRSRVGIELRNWREGYS